MSRKIKVLKDTPYDIAGKILSEAEFVVKYGAPAKGLLEGGIIGASNHFLQFFATIEELSIFKIGDVVWHENMNKPLTIVGNKDYPFITPDQVTLAAIESYPGTYKRFATPEEINTFKLFSYLDNHILVSQRELWYRDDIGLQIRWKEISNPHAKLQGIIRLYTSVDSDKIIITENIRVVLESIKVGCFTISREIVFELAKKLGVI